MSSAPTTDVEWTVSSQDSRTSIARGDPSHPGAAVLASSVTRSADHGEARLGVLVVMQNECPRRPRTSATASRERSVTRRRPDSLTNVSCAESRDEARERGVKSLRKWARRSH